MGQFMAYAKKWLKNGGRLKSGPAMAGPAGPSGTPMSSDE